jgi:hypothetical protein
LKDILGLLRIDSEERDVWISLATNKVVSKYFIPIFLQATALINDFKESEGDFSIITLKIESLEVIRATIIKILVLMTMPINPDLSLLTHNIKSMEDLEIKNVFQLPLKYGKIFHEIENSFVFAAISNPDDLSGPIYFTPTDSTAKNFYIALGNMVMSLIPDCDEIDSVMDGEEEDVEEDVIDVENKEDVNVDEMESEDDSFEVRESEDEEELEFSEKKPKERETIVIRRRKFLRMKFGPQFNVIYFNVRQADVIELELIFTLIRNLLFLSGPAHPSLLILLKDACVYFFFFYVIFNDYFFWLDIFDLFMIMSDIIPYCPALLSSSSTSSTSISKKRMDKFNPRCY